MGPMVAPLGSAASTPKPRMSLKKNRDRRSRRHGLHLNDPGEAQRSQDRQALPGHWSKTARALANLGTGIAPRHVRQDPGLINEHQARRIYRGHVFTVDFAFGRDIWSLLFARP